MHSLLLISILSATSVLSTPLPTTQSPGTASSSPINGLLAALGNTPIIGASVAALSGVLTDFEQGLAMALGIDTTESSTTCAAMQVIFARGTTEPGNVGLVTGPPFFDAIRQIVGSNNVAVQGVEYGASIEGFLKGGDPTGSEIMANMVTSTVKQCPHSAIVMSGYSQGGQLVHNAAKLLPAATMAKVSSVVIFGDPDFGEAVQGVSKAQTLVICHPDDNICQRGDLILLAHLTYSENATQAASFVATNANLAIGASKYANATALM